MTERPILFSAPMVRAILAGQKTQTRRALRVQPPAATEAVATFHHPDPRPMFFANDGTSLLDWCTPCPYGQPGDRLWVRETHIAFGRWETRFDEKKGRDAWHFVDLTPNSGRNYGYPADGDWPWPFKNKRALAGATPCWWTRPAIFMPRGATRLELEITGVRIERLQDISEADAMAEGAEPLLVPPDGGSAPHAEGFRELWTSINGRESWDANPWAWVVEFKRLES